jgi:hypothetical protein
LKKVIAFLLVVIGLVLAGIEIIAVVDPVGTKMADDGDPFGYIVSWGVHVFWLIVILACFTVAWRLFIASRAKSRVT